MDTPYPASGVRFAICPLCEDRRLVFSGLYSARCPECGYEPSVAFLQMLHEIAALPERREHHGRASSRGR